MRALTIAILTLLVLAQNACGDETRSNVDPGSATGVELDLVADGFGVPLWGTNAPGLDDLLFVVDQLGTVTALDVASPERPLPRATFLDVGPGGADLLVPLPPDDGFDERGLLGLAFHPDYATNGLLYTYTSEPDSPSPDFATDTSNGDRDPAAGHSVIREWRVEDPADRNATVAVDASRVLMRIEQPQANHNAGALAFGPDSMLYVALGDGGARDDEGVGHAPGGNGQDLTEGNVLGKILRIDPQGTNSANGNYGIPADNPFVDRAGADEIFALGFRNPFRMSFDRTSGLLYVGDVGQSDIEEVDIVVSGGNYGWPVKEGTFLFDGNGQGRGFAAEDSPGEPGGFVDPIVQYDHSQGVSITGGFVYRGSALPQFAGSYVFGDLTTQNPEPLGRLFVVAPDGELTDLVPVNNAEHRMYVTGFGQDAGGELYVMGLTRRETGGVSGSVFALVPASDG